MSFSISPHLGRNSTLDHFNEDGTLRDRRVAARRTSGDSDEGSVARRNTDGNPLPALSIAVGGDLAGAHPHHSSLGTAQSAGIASNTESPPVSPSFDPLDWMLASALSPDSSDLEYNTGVDEDQSGLSEEAETSDDEDESGSSEEAETSDDDGPLKSKGGAATGITIAVRRIAPLKKKKAVKSTSKVLTTTTGSASSIGSSSISPSSFQTPTAGVPVRMTRSMTAALNTNPTVMSIRVDSLSDAASQAIMSAHHKISKPICFGDLSEIAKWAVLSSDRKVFSRAQAANEDDPNGEFWRFPKLPAECQLMIWKEAKAMTPRIVKLKPETIPGIAHACHDSRKVAQYMFQQDGNKAGIFLDPKCDIVLLDKRSFSEEAVYHGNSIHTLVCSKVDLPVLKFVERVAISLDDLVNIWQHECFHCHLVLRFPTIFRDIKELSVLLRPGPSGAGYDDIYEFDGQVDNDRLQIIFDAFKRYFSLAQKCEAGKDPDRPRASEVDWENVSLRFIRMEKWAR